MSIATEFKTQQLALFKCKPDYLYNLLNEGFKIPKGYNLDDRYVVFGEMEKTQHYIMFNIFTGKMLPGIWHLDEFERIPEEDI